MAFVVPTAGHTVDRDAVLAWAREHMANFKVPRYLEVVDALPLNASGKVLEVRAARARAAVLDCRQLRSRCSVALPFVACTASTRSRCAAAVSPLR